MGGREGGRIVRAQPLLPSLLSLPSPLDVEETSGQLGGWKEKVTLLEKDLKFQEVKKNEAINKLAQVRGGR